MRDLRAHLSAYQRILVTLLQSAPIDFDAESELARLEDDIRADERARAADPNYATVFAAVLNAINCSGYRVEGPNADTDVNASDLADCITIELLTPRWKP
jgi:hypothetical protein